MNRSHVAAFALEPGELDLHHELVRYFDGDRVIKAALTLTDRRVVVVMTEQHTRWLRRALAVLSSRRIVVELRRATFARFEIRAARRSGETIAFHDVDGSILEVAVADSALWQKRIDRWVRDDVPPSPIPAAQLRSK